MALFAFPFAGMGQGQQKLSEACQQVSEKWKLDSTSCKGDRLLLVAGLKAARPDAITKEFLFRTLGQPNEMKKVFVGYPVKKNFREYIYYVYIDDCPKFRLISYAIVFVFDEKEVEFIKLEDREYCG
jgi:hypothetical protein